MNGMTYLPSRPQNMVLPDMFSACPGGNAAAAAEFHQALLRVGTWRHRSAWRTLPAMAGMENYLSDP